MVDNNSKHHSCAKMVFGYRTRELLTLQIGIKPITLQAKPRVLISPLVSHFKYELMLKA